MSLKAKSCPNQDRYRITTEQLEMFLEFYKDPDDFQGFLIYSMAAELKELREKNRKEGDHA